MKHFDYIVLGGGSGGIASAKRAAAHGAKVALIERGRLGGTCVNLGCIPKKVMFNAASLMHSIELAADYGITLPSGNAFSPTFEWLTLKAARDALIARLNRAYRDSLLDAGISLFAGEGQLVTRALARGRIASVGTPSTHVVAVGAELLSGPHVLIATGSHPNIPQVPGSELGISSDQFFSLSAKPQRVALVGGGYIAAELASVLAALGSKVTVLCRQPRLLSAFDDLLGDQLQHGLEDAGVHVERSVQVQSLSRSASGITLTLTKGTQLSGFDTLLWATGRSANTTGFGLTRNGVALGPDGSITVDEYQNTSVSGIYAVGDVSSHLALTPVAIAAGRQLSSRLFGGLPDSKLSYENVPSVVFSQPPIGTVGLGEAQAVSRYGFENLRVYESNFSNLRFALGSKRPRTYIKLLTLLPTEKVVGIHVIGHAADELIQGFAVALNLGATKADFDRCVPIHPTAAEELLTIGTKSRPPRHAV